MNKLFLVIFFISRIIAQGTDSVSVDTTATPNLEAIQSLKNKKLKVKSLQEN